MLFLVGVNSSPFLHNKIHPVYYQIYLAAHLIIIQKRSLSQLHQNLLKNHKPGKGVAFLT